MDDKKGKGKMKELEEEDVVSTLLLQPTTTVAASASSSNSTAASSSNSTAASSSRGVPSMMTYAASGFYRPRPGGGSMRPIRISNIGMHQQQLPLLAPAAPRQGEPKTEMCTRYMPGFNRCRFGNHCNFAHGIHELRLISHDPNFKTKLDATRQEEEAAALLQDAFAAHQEDQEFAAKSFSFTITSQDDPSPNGHHTSTGTIEPEPEPEPDMCPYGTHCPYKDIGCPLRHE